MKRSHYWIAGMCLVSLGFGYLAGTRGATATPPVAAEPETAGPQQSRASARGRETRENSGEELLAGLLKGRSAKDLSDSELVKIVLQLSKYDSTQSPVARARQNYQLQLLLEKLPVSRLEEVAAAIAADPESKRTGGLNTILTPLAGKDPQRALAWAKTQKNSSGLLATIIGIMAKDDPMTAADLYRQGLLEGTFSQNDGWQASFGISTAMARLGKKALLAFMDQLPQQQRSQVLSGCFRELPEGERIEMLDEMHQHSKDGRMQDYNFKNIFSNALSSDRDRAEAWLAKLEPGAERASFELYNASSLSRMGDAEAAREAMSRAIAQSPGKEKELLKEAIDQMAYSTPGDIAVFAGLLPDGVELLAEDLKNQADHTVYRGFSGLTGLANAIRDPAERAKLITGVLEQFTASTTSSSQPARLNDTDFEIFAHQLQKLDLTGEHAVKVQQALAAARSAQPKPRP